MPNNTYDVIIVGAGGAGLMTARELGRKQIKTLLIDRKKDLFSFTFNTLGSFMKIEDFGLTENVVAQKLDRFYICSRLISVKVDCEALTLDKSALHKELFASLDRNFVDVETGKTINDFETDESGNILSIIDDSGNVYHSKIFVDASGNAGILSKKFGMQTDSLDFATGVEYNVKYLGNENEAYILMGKKYQGGYGWIFPLKDGRAIIGFGSIDKTVIKSLKKRLNHILEFPEIRKLVEKDNNNCEGGSIPVTPVLTKFVHQNLVCVGDSVSQVNPVAGEGYKFIFESAVMVANSICNSLKNNNLNILNQYETEWKNRFQKNYNFAKFAQQKAFKYSKSNLLVDFGMLYLKSKPSEKIIKVISGEYNRG